MNAPTPTVRRPVRLAVYWAVVGVPLAYGLGQTLVRAAGLFG